MTQASSNDDGGRRQETWRHTGLVSSCWECVKIKTMHRSTTTEEIINTATKIHRRHSCQISVSVCVWRCVCVWSSIYKHSTAARMTPHLCVFNKAFQSGRSLPEFCLQRLIPVDDLRRTVRQQCRITVHSSNFTSYLQAQTIIKLETASIAEPLQNR